MSDKAICIIPARGGSKRIPRKNIKHFLGKPIIAYSIDIALKSNLFHEVMVSTDDKEIADIAANYGASVPFLRSTKNADDLATTYDVIQEVLMDYEKKGRNYIFGCCLYPCAPLVQLDSFLNSFNDLKIDNLDSVFPICRYSTPIFRSLQLNDDNTISPYFESTVSSRSQDFKNAYFDAGQYYMFKVASLLKQQTLYMNRSKGQVISELLTQDIDNESDWQLAEMKYKILYNQES